MGNDGHYHTMAGQHTAINPGDVVLDAYVVDEVTGSRIVSAIHHQVSAGQQLLGVLGVQISDDALHGYLTVDTAQPTFSGDRLGQTGIAVILVVEELALQVVQLDEVAVNDGHMSYAGTHQSIGDESTVRPTAY